MNRVIYLFAVLGLITFSADVQAARLLQPSVIVGKPMPAIVAPQPVAPPVVITMPPPAAVVVPCYSEKCCPTPCITYRSVGGRRSCLDDKPGASLTVAVKNPQTGCVTAVPICIPICCLDQPCVTSRCGLFHRGIVTYDYNCGFRIVFTFDRAGDLLVTYHY